MRGHVVVALCGPVLACGGADEAAPNAEIACAPATAWAAPDTQLVQRATTVITFRNDGAPGPISLALDGADAAEFVIAPVTDCDEGRRLGTGDLCFVQVDFAPQSLGAKRASLRVGATRIALTGTAIATTTGLFIGAANLSFSRGAVALGISEFIVSNQGTTPIPLGAPAFSGAGFIGNTASDCGPMLTGGAACTMRVAYTPLARGCAIGAMHLGGATVPIDGRFISGVEVYPRGAGTGTITSSPAGIDCGTGDVGVCARAFDDDRVTLTATPTGGSHLAGASATRTISLVPRSFTPSWIVHFASPAAKAIALSLDGEAVGTVSYDPVASTCTDDCTLHVEPGDHPVLRARTPSRFTGWSGACGGIGRTCELGLTVNDRAATATFAKDDGEVTTLLPEVPVAAAAFFADGDLLAAGDDRLQEPPALIVSRLAPTGAMRWSRALPSEFRWVVDAATTATGAAYLVVLGPDQTTYTLLRLDGAGATVWAQPLPTTTPAFVPVLAPVGDEVALAWNDELAVRAATDGTVRWRTPIELPLAITASAAELAVARYDVAASATTIDRFAFDGTPRGAPWTISGLTRTKLAYDHQSGLVMATEAALVRLDATGATTFSVPEVDGTVGRFVAIDRDGRIVTARAHRFQGRSAFAAGALVLAHDATGAEVWRLDKDTNGASDYGGPGFDAVEPYDLISDNQGHVALIGVYNLRQPWIEILAVP
ncbi:MAG: hypothetical protein IPH80_37165 [Myxococcales bacterium]|nr:hypothetical protein [Myxococcales bacterium]MBP6847771.1 hypothetical protein [Kofleriaceae bacterium]